MRFLKSSSQKIFEAELKLIQTMFDEPFNRLLLILNEIREELKRDKYYARGSLINIIWV